MRRIPGLARSTGERHAVGALRHSRVQVWSASARRSPRRPARRASAELSTGPLVGYGITAGNAVPGCRYARTVVARWLSRGQPTRGLAWTARVVRAEWTQRSALRAPQDGTAGSTSGSDTSSSGTRASTVAFGPVGWLNTRDHAGREEAGGAARHGLTVGPGIPCGNLRSRAMVWAASFGKEVSGS